MDKSDLIQEIVEQLMRCQRPSSLASWKKLGLSHAQIGMLHVLSHHGQTRVNQMADFLGVTKSAITQLLEPLIAKGLVNRTTDVKDRRIAHLSLSAKGKKAVKELAKLKSAGLRSALTTLNKSELEQLKKLLNKMSAK